MKAKIKENNIFRPITIKLTIETKEELLNLYERLLAEKECIDADNPEYLNNDITPFDQIISDESKRYL